MTSPVSQADLARCRVLVVGDAMLDRYVYGTVKRISPEAPVPVLAVEREVAMPGGAGNVVRNLTALGAAVAFVSVVGDDQAGSDLTGLIGGQPGVEDAQGFGPLAGVYEGRDVEAGPFRVVLVALEQFARDARGCGGVAEAAVYGVGGLQVGGGAPAR